jgi:arginase family enzyme
LAAGAYDQTMCNSLLHARLSDSFLLPGVPAHADALRKHDGKAAVYGIHFDAKNISCTGANYGPHDIRDVSCQLLTSNAILGFDLLATLNSADAGNCGIVLADAAKTFERAEADYLQQTRRTYSCDDYMVH